MLLARMVMKIKRIIKIAATVFFILLVVLLIGAYFIAKKGFDKQVEQKRASIERVLNIKEFMNKGSSVTETEITEAFGGYDSKDDYYIEGTFHLHEYFSFEEVNLIKEALKRRVQLIEAEHELLTKDNLISNFGIEKPEALERLRKTITRINENMISYKIDSFNKTGTSFVFSVSAEGLEFNAQVDIVYIKDELYLFMEVNTNGLVK